MSAHLFSQGIRFLLCLFVIKFPLFDIEIPDGLHIRCNHRGHFRNYGHNLGAETPVPAGTPQPDPRQETAGSSCGPHRNQGNAESWKTHHNGQKHCSQPKARERFHLTLVQIMLQVTGFHRDRDQTHASPRGGQARGESEMWELPGKDSGKGNPMEAALVTLRLADVWSGKNVRKRRSNAGPLEERVTGTPVWENSEQHPSQATGAPITWHARPLTNPWKLARFFTDVFSGVFSTAVVERAGNGTTLMPKEMDGIHGPSPHDRIPRSYCHVVIQGTESGKPLLRPPPATLFLETLRIV